MNMMTEAMKTEVFAFAKEVHVNKTKLMGLVERVVSMVEVTPATPVKTSRVAARNKELVDTLRATLGNGVFTVKDLPSLHSDRHYMVRKLEAEGILIKAGKVEKTGRGRKDFMWKFAETV
jgi:hypothetical protein